MGYMVFQYEDPALHPTFKNMYGEQYQRVMREMNEKLDDRVRAFGEWQVNEFYPIMHQRFNETYKRIYYTDMPYNKYYAGPRKKNPLRDILCVFRFLANYTQLNVSFRLH